MPRRGFNYIDIIAPFYKKLTFVSTLYVLHVWKPHVYHSHAHTNTYKNTYTQTDSIDNFELLTHAGTQGIPYDYASIMHYSASELSKNGQFTIVPILDTVPPDTLGSSITPTPFDYLHVNLLYCGGKRAAHKHLQLHMNTFAYSCTRMFIHNSIDSLYMIFFRSIPNSNEVFENVFLSICKSVDKKLVFLL